MLAAKETYNTNETCYPESVQKDVIPIADEVYGDEEKRSYTDALQRISN
jgi:hypothetical protein